MEGYAEELRKSILATYTEFISAANKLATTPRLNLCMNVFCSRVDIEKIF
jgi:hypothetical protein